MFQVVTYAASDMMDPPSQGLSAIVAGTLCFGEGSNLLVKEVGITDMMDPPSRGPSAIDAGTLC